MTEQDYLVVVIVFGVLLLVLSACVVYLAHEGDRLREERSTWKRMYYYQLEKEQETVAQLLKERTND